MNPFGDDLGAEGYDKSRPYFHPLVFARVAERISLSAEAWGLDLGCGTGQSTAAMKAISSRVVGLDASAAMLRCARNVDTLRYVQGMAEQLPFVTGHFDLVSIGLAFHWFDRDLVLAEIRRVLKTGGWLTIFTSGLRGTMRDNPPFASWHQSYLKRFPQFPRNSAPLARETAAECSFREVLSERFTHLETYTVDQFINYLCTQTNVTDSVRSGAQTLDTARQWLYSNLRPLFTSETETFEYSGELSLYEKVTG